MVPRITRLCPDHFVLEIDACGQSSEAPIVITFGTTSCRCCRSFQEDNGRRKTPERSGIGVTCRREVKRRFSTKTISVLPVNTSERDEKLANYFPGFESRLLTKNLYSMGSLLQASCTAYCRLSSDEMNTGVMHATVQQRLTVQICSLETCICTPRGSQSLSTPPHKWVPLILQVLGRQNDC